MRGLVVGFLLLALCNVGWGGDQDGFTVKCAGPVAPPGGGLGYLYILTIDAPNKQREELQFQSQEKGSCEGKAGTFVPNGNSVTYCACFNNLFDELTCYKLLPDGSISTLVKKKWYILSSCSDAAKEVEKQQIYPTAPPPQPPSKSYIEWLKEKIGLSSDGKTGETKNPSSTAESGNMIKPVESIQTGGGGTTSGVGGTAGGGR